MAFDLSWISTVLSLVHIAPKVKTWIDIGLPVLDEMQKSDPKMIPILEKVGVQLFPTLTDTVHKVAAAADAIFDPHGTEWVQRSLNKLGATPKLDEDGDYGQLTKKAVQAFQAAHPECQGADGWAGPKTTAVIVAELAKLG